MRAVIPADSARSPRLPSPGPEASPAVQRALTPFLELGNNSDSVVIGSAGEFVSGTAVHPIPRVIFMGPKGGGDTLRIGIFAAFHGDEPEGAEALGALLRDLEANPAPARGYHLYIYPICNPSGFAAGTRCNAAGHDLAAQFWRGSDQPEIYYLERELGVRAFQGVISLQLWDDPRLRFSFGWAGDSVLRAVLSSVALQAAYDYLPVGPAEGHGYGGPRVTGAGRGFLTATDELRPKPFEINVEIPRDAVKPLQLAGTTSALKAILDAYRAFIGTQENI